MENSGRILIVDDEESTVGAMSDILQRAGYKVSAAFNGKDAMEAANKNKPDLILLDIVLPDIDGFKICKKLKADELSKSIPILMITGLDSMEDRLKGLSAGADDFLNKPIEQTELLLRIKSFLEIKSYQDRLENSLTELSANQKTKEDLMHMIIHDLNNPLFGITLHLETLLFEKERLSDKQVKRINECIRFSREIENLVRNILDIYKMEIGQLILNKELTDMIELVDDVVNLFRPRIEAKDIFLSLNSADNVTPVWVDSNLVKRVIGNLLGNAIRHTSEKGKIGITIDRKIRKDELVVTVTDTGTGIKPEYHKKIFDKFLQLEVRKTSSMIGLCGLGLPFCRMVVEAHQGRIWVESEGEGKGCSFSFSIPIAG